jgi:hypothetical protein
VSSGISLSQAESASGRSAPSSLTSLRAFESREMTVDERELVAVTH